MSWRHSQRLTQLENCSIREQNQPTGDGAEPRVENTELNKESKGVGRKESQEIC